MSTTVKTGEVRFSYAYVFEPRESQDGGKAKYGVSILVDKEDAATIKALRAGIEEAYNDKKSIFGGKTLKVIKTPLRDGDEEKPEDPNYAGKLFFNANSIRKVQVIDRKGTPLDEDEFYSGCYGKAVVQFYAYDAGSSKGIAAGLQAILKTKDGENLAGGTDANAAFADEITEGDDATEGDDW